MRKNVVCAACSAVVMLFLPWGVVTFVRGDSGMTACLLLFFVVNPTAALCVGAFSGKREGAAWFQPLILSALFLLGAWAFFDAGEQDFTLYAGVYLFIGYCAAVTAALRNRRKGPAVRRL